jgi:hypothetical protein
MALSFTSLELDSITTELLFTRGSQIVSQQTYIPQYSTLGTGVYGTWNVLNISTVLFDVLYGYTSFPQLQEKVDQLIDENTSISTSLQFNVYTLSTFTVSSFEFLQFITGTTEATQYGPSTISSFRNTLIYDSTISLERFSNVSSKKDDISSIGYWIVPTNFLSSLYNQNSNTIINLAYFYYTPSTNTQGIQSRYIGPGISSFYSTGFASLISTNVASSFPAILSNASTSISSINSSLQGQTLITQLYVNNVGNLIESYSSISTLYQSNVIIFNLSSISSYFGTTVSSMSTYIGISFNNFTVPSLGPSISTFNSSLTESIAVYNTDFISSLRSQDTLGRSLSSMSTYSVSTIVSTYLFFEGINIESGFIILSTINLNTIIPVLNTLSISTTQNGVIQLNSTIFSSLSTYSTLFPSLLGANLLNTLLVDTTNVCTLSSQIVYDVSSLSNISRYYNTAVGVSSVYRDLTSSVNTSYTNYGSQLSSLLSSFNLNLANVNSAPGVSSLASTGTFIFSSATGRIREIDIFVNISFSTQIDYINYGPSTYINTISTIGSNLSSYVSTFYDISSGIVNYNNLSTQTVNSIYYISSMLTIPNGVLYSNIFILSSLNLSSLKVLDPFMQSSFYYNYITFPLDYSTNSAVLFFNYQASTISGFSTIRMSSFILQKTTPTGFTFELQGSMQIKPYQYYSTTFLIGNSNPYLYSIDPDSYSTVSTQLFVFNGSGPASNLYGLVQTDSTAIVPVNKLESFVYNTFSLEFSCPNPRSVTYTPFYSPSANPLPGIIFSCNAPIEFFSLESYAFYSQLSSINATNQLMIIKGLGVSSPVTYHTFSTVTSGATTYQSLGPLTSLTTNGQLYLLTATSNVFYSYQQNFWYEPVGITSKKFYTMYLTNTLDIGSETPTEFSTILGIDSSNVTEIHDAVWTGKTWVIAGNGAFVSRDAYSWTKTLPSTSERLLRYRSLDFNGEEILLAHISSSPVYIEFLKSKDFGYTWSSVSSIKMPAFDVDYLDIIPNSTILYSVKVKWAFDCWNAFITPANSNIDSGTGSSTIRGMFKSLDGGNTWTSNKIPVITNVDSNTLGILFEPIQQSQPSLQLPNFNVYARNDPVRNAGGHILSARFSSIVINEGDLVIRKNTLNSQQRGLVGINLLNPGYALDIGYGNARKPTGVNWINPSDERIKVGISSVNGQLICESLEKIQLVSFEWLESYRESRRLSSEPQLGFIAQNIEKILPSSILVSNEEGIIDFKTVNTDQLYKMKFGVTQTLLYRVSSLQSRIMSLSIALDRLS